MATDARKANTMTIREMYMNAIAILTESDAEIGVDEVVAKMQEQLAKLDAQNEKRKNAERKPSPKQLAAAEYDAKLMEAISEILTNDFQPRTFFAEALDITPSKASVLLNKMVAQGTVEKGESKSDKGKIVAYKRA